MSFQVGPFQPAYQQSVDEELLGTGFGGSLYYRGVTVRIFGKPYRIVRRDQLQAIIEKEFSREVKQARQAKQRKQEKEKAPVLTLSTELLEEISKKNIQTLSEANSLLLVIDELLMMEEMVMLLMMEAI